MPIEATAMSISTSASKGLTKTWSKLRPWSKVMSYVNSKSSQLCIYVFIVVTKGYFYFPKRFFLKGDKVYILSPIIGTATMKLTWSWSGIVTISKNRWRRAEPVQPHHQSNFTVKDIFTYMVKMPKINTSNLTDGQWVFEKIQLLK